MTVGRPSLYQICQLRYEEYMDYDYEEEDWKTRPEFQCICGYQNHTISYAGTPILFKKGDHVVIEAIPPPRATDELYLKKPLLDQTLDRTTAFYGTAWEPDGLMPRDWISPRQAGTFYIISAVAEALGRTITDES